MREGNPNLKCFPGYRCTGAQASCGCGYRGEIHKGAGRHKKAKADLQAHIADMKKRRDTN